MNPDTKNLLIGVAVGGGVTYLLVQAALHQQANSSAINTANPTGAAIGTLFNIVSPSLSLTASPSEQNCFDNAYAIKYGYNASANTVAMLPANGDVLTTAFGTYTYNGSTAWVKTTTPGAAIGTAFNTVAPSLTLATNPTEQNYFDNAFAVQYNYNATNNTIASNPVNGDTLTTIYGTYTYNGKVWAKTTNSIAATAVCTGAAVGTLLNIVTPSLSLPANPTEQNYFDNAYAIQYGYVAANNTIAVAPVVGDILNTPYGSYAFNGTVWVKETATGAAVGTTFNIISPSSVLQSNPSEQNYFDNAFAIQYNYNASANTIATAPASGDVLSTPYGTYTYSGSSWSKTTNTPATATASTGSPVGTQFSIVTPSLTILPSSPTEQNYFDNAYATQYNNANSVTTGAAPVSGTALSTIYGTYTYNGTAWNKTAVTPAIIII